MKNKFKVKMRQSLGEPTKLYLDLGQTNEFAHKLCKLDHNFRPQVKDGGLDIVLIPMGPDADLYFTSLEFTLEEFHLTPLS